MTLPELLLVIGLISADQAVCQDRLDVEGNPGSPRALRIGLQRQRII